MWYCPGPHNLPACMQALLRWPVALTGVSSPEHSSGVLSVINDSCHPMLPVGPALQPQGWLLMAPVPCCGLHSCTALNKPCFTGLSEQLHGNGPGGSNAMIAVFPAQHLEPTLAAMSRLYLVHLIRVPWGPGVAHNNHNLGTHGTALCLVPPLLLSKQCSRQCSSHKHTRPVCNPVCWLSRLI